MRAPGADTAEDESVVTQVLHCVQSMLAIALPFLRRRRTSNGLTSDQRLQLQIRARVNLGVVESLSMLMMSSWHNESERKRLEFLLQGRDVPAPLVLDRSRGVLSSKGLGTNNGPVTAPRTVKRKDKLKASVKGLGWRNDSLEDLRRRRAGSPPTDVEDTSHTSAESTSSEITSFARPRNPDPPTPPMSDKHRPRRTDRRRTDSDEIPVYEKETIGFNETGRMAKTIEAVEVGVDVSKDILEGVVLFSESKEGWWMYVSVMCSVVVALLMGYIG